MDKGTHMEEHDQSMGLREKHTKCYNAGNAAEEERSQHEG
jgi:hypothetical protein